MKPMTFITWNSQNVPGPMVSLLPSRADESTPPPAVRKADSRLEGSRDLKFTQDFDAEIDLKRPERRKREREKKKRERNERA